MVDFVNFYSRYRVMSVLISDQGDFAYDTNKNVNSNET